MTDDLQRPPALKTSSYGSRGADEVPEKILIGLDVISDAILLFLEAVTIPLWGPVWLIGHFVKKLREIGVGDA